MAEQIGSDWDIVGAVQDVVVAHADQLARLAPTGQDRAYISGYVARALADAISDCEGARTSAVGSDEWEVLLGGSGLDEETRHEFAAMNRPELAARARVAVENSRDADVVADRFLARLRTEHPELADAVDYALETGAAPVLLHRWAVTPTVAAGGATPASRAYVGDPNMMAAVRNELLTGVALDAGIRVTRDTYEALLQSTAREALLGATGD